MISAKERTIRIEKTVYRGFGLGYLYGKPIFIPHAYPGELVLARVAPKGRKVFRGEVIDIVDNPASYRITPPCRWSGRCGGCHYQEIDYAAQLGIKQEIIRESLTYIGKLANLPPLQSHPSPQRFRYRPQCSFQVGSAEGRVRLGFFEYESQRFLPVDDCLLLAEPLIGIKHELECFLDNHHSLFKALSSIDCRTETNGKRIVLSFNYSQKIPSGTRSLFERVQGSLPQVSAVLFQGWNSECLEGDGEIAARVNDLTFTIAAGSFFQNNQFQWPIIHELTRQRVKPGGNDHLLDLFCGSGFWSLAVGRHVSDVFGIEGNQCSVDLAGRNATANGLANTRFEHRDLTKGLGTVNMSPTVVIINPPRSGCSKKLLNDVAALYPQRIYYMSCDPPSLARDIERLTRKACMRIESIDFIDMFPHTYSIETAITLGPGIQASV